MEKELLDRLSQLEVRLDKLEKSHCQDTGNVKRGKADPADLNVGMMSYCGKYESPDGEIGSTFEGDVSITKILKINSKDLAQVIDALSSEERLDIIKLLLKKPLTAKEIMEILNFSTTGKVYHHLSFLEKLGIIRKKNEKFSISGKSVSCVLFVMLGVSQILEGRE